MIENYKNFDKITKENNKKSNKKRPYWNYYYSHKKNHKLDLNDKIEINKNFDKKTEKKIKVERPNRNILYIQIRNQWLNWKQIKL